MVSVIVSKWVGDAFGRDGIYDEQVLESDYIRVKAVAYLFFICAIQIIMNGYPHLDNKAEYAPALIISPRRLCCT
jgi:hypothetical protein